MLTVRLRNPDRELELTGERTVRERLAEPAPDREVAAVSAEEVLPVEIYGPAR